MGSGSLGFFKFTLTILFFFPFELLTAFLLSIGKSQYINSELPDDDFSDYYYYVPNDNDQDNEPLVDLYYVNPIYEEMGVHTTTINK